MKKILTIILLLSSLFCFSQNKIMTLKSDFYTIDKGGLSRDYEMSTKIKVYEDKINFRYTDRVNSKTLSLKDMKINSDGSFTARIDSKKTRYVIYTSNGDNSYLSVEYDKYIKIYKIKK